MTRQNWGRGKEMRGLEGPACEFLQAANSLVVRSVRTLRLGSWESGCCSCMVVQSVQGVVHRIASQNCGGQLRCSFSLAPDYGSLTGKAPISPSAGALP